MELTDQIYVGQVNDLLRMVGVEAACCYGTRMGPGLDTAYGYYITVTSRRVQELIWLFFRHHGEWVVEERHKSKSLPFRQVGAGHREDPTKVAFALLRALALRLSGRFSELNVVDSKKTTFVERIGLHKPPNGLQ